MALPEGIKIHSSLRLISWHPRGTLDFACVRGALDFTETQEHALPASFNRFVDLTGLEAIPLGFGDMEELAQSRVETYHGPEVRLAILAVNPLAFGMARMYEQLMRRSPIEVGVFTTLGDAAEWLGVPEDALSPEG